MRSTRIATTVAALLTASLALSACGSDDDAQARSEESARDVRAAITRLFPPLTDAIEVVGTWPPGDGRYAGCGSPVPGSVKYSVEATIPQSNTAGRPQGDRIVDVAEADGWTVTTRSGSSIIAERGSLRLSVQFGGAVNVQVGSPCLDAPSDVITSLTERPLEPVDLS